MESVSICAALHSQGAGQQLDSTSAWHRRCFAADFGFVSLSATVQ